LRKGGLAARGESCELLPHLDVGKGKSDLAISVVKKSVAQIAAFLFPALVLTSYLFGTHLTFDLEPVYIGALFLTALAVWQITGDGEAQMFEGIALIAIYAVLAAFTLYD
jgi:Ca2+:H+ antiporter